MKRVIALLLTVLLVCLCFAGCKKKPQDTAQPTGEVVLSDEEEIFNDTVICNRVNFQSIEDLKPGETLRCKAKVRYHHVPEDAILERMDEKRIKITFDKPVRAAAPGQSAVFYDDNDCVIGGGIIE